MKNKQKKSSDHTKSKSKKDINSYGYNVAHFNVLEIPVKRDSETGRLVSLKSKPSKKNLNESS